MEQWMDSETVFARSPWSQPQLSATSNENYGLITSSYTSNKRDGIASK